MSKKILVLIYLLSLKFIILNYSFIYITNYFLIFFILKNMIIKDFVFVKDIFIIKNKQSSE